jgi:sugar lactone lactonase YvrE
MVEVLTGGRTVLAEGFGLTEAPRWRDDRLFFSDIHGHKVHTVDAAGGVETVAAFDGPCSGLGFMPGGDLLVSLMRATKVVRVAGGQVREHADLSAFADTEINDMVVDESGRAYVTQLGPARTPGGPEKRFTRLVIVEPDGAARVGWEGLQGPNGVAITADGRSLVFSEAGGWRMSALDILAGGDLGALRTVATLPDRVCPDGMCLDAQGGVWAAAVADLNPPMKPGPGFLRFDAAGTLTHRISLEPGRHAVACAFGGPDRRTLFLCTSGTIDGAEAARLGAARIERIEIAGLSGAGRP